MAVKARSGAHWIGAALLMALLATACGGGAESPRDLVFNLATANAVVEVPVGQIADRGPDEVTERTGAQEAVIDDLFLFEILPPADLARVDDVAVAFDEGLWFYRDPSFQSSLTAMLAGAASAVVALEQRLIVSDLGVSVQGWVVAIAADGSIIASDWAGGPGEPQLDAIARIVRSEGLGWPEALAALAGAARDEALDRALADPLGAMLLEAARSAG